MAAMVQAMLLGPWMSMTGRQKMGSMGVAKPSQKDLVFMKELLEAGKVVPVIDRRYPFGERLRLSGILKKDTPEEKSSSRWTSTPTPDKALHLTILRSLNNVFQTMYYFDRAEKDIRRALVPISARNTLGSAKQLLRTACNMSELLTSSIQKGSRKDEFNQKYHRNGEPGHLI